MLALPGMQAAALRLQGQVFDTFRLGSRTLSQVTGAQVFLKFEHLQFTVSFKGPGRQQAGAADGRGTGARRGWL